MAPQIVTDWPHHLTADSLVAVGIAGSRLLG
jgi:hypothetical protein